MPPSRPGRRTSRPRARTPNLPRVRGLGGEEIEQLADPQLEEIVGQAAILRAVSLAQALQRSLVRLEALRGERRLEVGDQRLPEAEIRLCARRRSRRARAASAEAPEPHARPFRRGTALEQLRDSLSSSYAMSSRRAPGPDSSLPALRATSAGDPAGDRAGRQIRARPRSSYRSGPGRRSGPGFSRQCSGAASASWTSGPGPGP